VKRYSEILLDHFNHPRNAGTALPGDTGVGTAHYPTCGDVVRIFLRIEDEIVADGRFQASGCGPGIACTSALLEMAVGRSAVSAAALTAEDIARILELPQEKAHCAELAVTALRNALQDHASRAIGKE